jgi:hypothetical protein
MSFYEMQAYAEAAERDDTERLVLTMNAMAVAFGGTAKQRKEMATLLLTGGDIEQQAIDLDGFGAVLGMQHLATPMGGVPASDDLRAWANAETVNDQTGILTGKRNG